MTEVQRNKKKSIRKNNKSLEKQVQAHLGTRQGL